MPKQHQADATVETTDWPALPSIEYKPVVNQTLEVSIRNAVASAPTAPVIILHAAWTLLLSQYAHTDEVLFGTSATPSTALQGEPHVLPCAVVIIWEANLAAWLNSLASLVGRLKDESGVPSSLQCRSIILHRESSQQDTSDDEHQQRIDQVSRYSGVAIILEFLSVGSQETPTIRLHFDDVLLKPVQARRVLSQLQHVFEQLSFQTDPAARILDINMLGEQDKAQIWRWNAKTPRAIESVVQDIFSIQVQEHPNRQAVDAWDGSMTYMELDSASTSLAIWLLERGIAAPGRVITWCYNKTIWTTIVLLAIAKSGSIFVALDPQQPRGRLRVILAQLNASVILARPDTVDLASSLGKNVEIVDDAVLRGDVKPNRLAELLSRPVSPTDHLYIVFTSGSTGTPKGAIVSHANLCSGATHQSKALGFAGSRVFDSSTYSFDAYVCNTFHTLLNGGCLCVPSEEDRVNNLQATLQRMKVEFLQLTPSTSRLVDPSKLPLLHTLELTGEKITRTVLDPWLATKRVRVVNAYGPSECTIMCAANTDINNFEDAQSIGFGLGSNLWLADIHDVTRLAPLGAVGEILIEGPIVGQGYLDDEQKTRDSRIFVEGNYLRGVAFAPTGPLFRTKDLARYNSDGSISFIGRADTQIKINGQRVEIEEVEYHLGKHLHEGVDFVVEPVQWPSGVKQLVTFIRVPSAHDRFDILVNGIAEKLTESLPAYMIPSAYFLLTTIPMTQTGKTDRKKLREMAINFPEQLIGANSIIERSGAENTSTSVYEATLKRLWAKVLYVDESTVSRNDNFFSKADSLVAMKLVALARSEGLDKLMLADIIVNPNLNDLASVLEARQCKEQSQGPADSTSFSLLNLNAEEVITIRHTLADAFECDVSDVEDIYPCSPFQEQMVMLHALNARDFATQVIVPLASDIDIARLHAAWDQIAQDIPILRTRISDTKTTSTTTSKLVQSVIKGDIPWSEYSEKDECLLRERDKGQGLGQPLLRVAIAQSSEYEKSLIVTMHHAAYDGWFLNLLSDAIRDEYFGRDRQSLTSYRDFIHFLELQDAAEAGAFWEKYLQDAPVQNYLQLPSPDYRPSASNILERKVSGLDWNSSDGVTANTFLKTAWALALSKNSVSSDIIFGSTLLGRDGSMANMERIGGPTIATVPMRVLVDWDAQSAIQLLQSVAHQHAEAIPFLHFGIERIRHLNMDTERACDFPTFLVVHPARSSHDEDAIFDLSDGMDDLTVFNTFSVFMDCLLAKDGIAIRATFDSRSINGLHVEKLIDDFERILRTLCTADRSKRLSDLGILNEEEQRQISVSRSHGKNNWIVQTDLHLRQYLPPTIAHSAVEIVQEGDIDRVVAFVSGATLPKKQVVEGLFNAMERLTKHLPRHCLPSKFLVIENMPLNASGEKDRDALKALARSAPTESFIDAQRLVQLQHARERPQTVPEQLLQRLWSTTLNIDYTLIGRSSSFLFLGGDSLAAMRLVAGLRGQGFSITVPEVLEAPRLADMAMKLEDQGQQKSSAFTSVAPFALLSPEVDMASLARACDIDPDDIEDAYPCSPMQEAMLARTAREADDYVSRYLIRLPDDVETKRLREAWDYVTRTTPILHTRIVDVSGHGLLQLVVKGSVPWTEVASMEETENLAFGFGQPLLRLELVKKAPNGSPALRMNIHHAIYDKDSNGLVLNTIERFYHGEEVQKSPVAYNSFIKYLLEDVDAHQAEAFWTGYLSDLNASPFPALPSPKYRPKANKHLAYRISDVELSNAVTLATTLKSAWAITISQYSNSTDVVFGSLSSGRQAALAGIELIAGPTIAIIPQRARIDWSNTTVGFLKAMQSQSTKMVAYEHIGLDRLHRLSEDAHRASQFQSLFVVQPTESSSVGGRLFLSVADKKEIPDADMYGLILECTWDAISKVVSINLSFDDQVLEDMQVRNILKHLEHVVRQLGQQASDKVALEHMDLLPPADRHRLIAANAVVPATIHGRVGDLIKKRVNMQPDAVAIDAWDGRFSYRELYDYALSFAHCLVQRHRIQPEMVVPVCCAKSRWTPVAMLGIILAGGVTLLLDPFQPVERLQGIVTQVNAHLIVASTSTQGVAAQLASNIIVLDEKFIGKQLETQRDSLLPEISPESACYISFTSGSTGTPKGAIITHSNCCSALTYQTEAFGILPTTRTLDLSSYSFDIAWHEFLFTFSVGACLCIPSDEDRRNDLIGSIQNFDVNYLHLTPSLARTINPTEVPGIKTVVFGGEPLALDDIRRWGPEVDIRDGYGPTECTITSTVARYGTERNIQPNLGKAYGLNAWILSCLQPGELAPFGGVGELVVEGPLVGRGYLNNPASTKAAFVNTLSAQDGGQARKLYRTGDLVRYGSRGELIFAGRRDLQVKVRGQRIELGEVETHVRRNIGDSIIAVAEVVESGNDSQALVLFLSPSTMNGSDLDAAQDAAHALAKSLLRTLPRYMVPSSFFVLDQLPLTSTGKIDRRKLKAHGSRALLEQQHKRNMKSAQEPRTEDEAALRQAWSQVLGLDTSSIGRDDGFLELGGDSLSAIRLVSAARKLRLPLSVTLVFQNDRLEDMARALRSEHVHSLPRLSNGQVGDRADGMNGHANVQIADDTKNISDLQLPFDSKNIDRILPLTDFQEYAVRATLGSPRTEVNYFWIQFHQPINIARLQDACQRTVNSIEILRTFFFRNRKTYIQVVLKQFKINVQIVEAEQALEESCKEVAQADMQDQLTSESPFAKFFIVHSSQDMQIALMLRISHVQYDGLSLGHLVNVLAALYDHRRPPQISPFSSYIEKVSERTTAHYDYWRTSLRDAPTPTSLSDNGGSVALVPGHRLRVTKTIKLPQIPKGVTAATVFTAAWAFVLAYVTGSQDVVFGRAVSGRSAGSLDFNTENIVGPCLNLIPVRVTNVPKTPNHAIFHALHQQFIDSMPYETVGLRDIVANCTSWPRNTTFGSIVYFQNVEKDFASKLGEQEVQLKALEVPGTLEPPEPPRLNVWPGRNDDHVLELLIPKGMCDNSRGEALLDAMEMWLGQIA
ncbi:Nn.00g017910.m01.CDS01 [Neocucurbitaria sp. VM-36]